MQDEKRTFTFASADKTHTIHAVTWFPTTQPCRGIIQVSHGMTEYFDRYEEFAHAMTKHGFAVSGHDHLGHKSSVTSDEELGFLADKDGWKYLVADLKTHTQWLHDNYPDTPLFLLGHSMGSFAARCHLVKYNSLLDGAIIVGTGGPSFGAKLGKLLSGTICRLGFGKKPSRFLDKLAFGQYNERFDGRTKYDWLSRDMKLVDRYVADPYCTFLFTASGFHDLFSLYTTANELDSFRAVPKTFPILILSGANDPVGDYGLGPQKVAELFEQTGHVDVVLRLYPGARHELLNETNRREVFDGIVSWIEHRI